MKLLIGAPVYRREWIIERWFDHMFAALEKAEIDDYAFCFVGDYRDPTFEILSEVGQDHKVYTYNDREESISGRERYWNHDLYYKMVYLRNDLLRFPRELEPEFFLSADTDILLHPDCIGNLIESTDRFDAVSGKCYMTPHGKFHPSWANLGRSQQLIRKDASGVFPCQVIMALKMMKPSAYHIDYRFHKQGEDTGWSINCKERGLTLGFDGRVANKHVLERHMLDKVDPRVGF